MENLLSSLVALCLISCIEMYNIIGVHSDGDASYDYGIGSEAGSWAEQAPWRQPNRNPSPYVHGVVQKPARATMYPHIPASTHRLTGSWWQNTPKTIPLHGGGPEQPNTYRNTPFNPRPNAYAPAAFNPRPNAYAPAAFNPRPNAYAPAAFNPRPNAYAPAAFNPRPNAYAPPSGTQNERSLPRGLVSAPPGIDFCSLSCGHRHIACKDNGLVPDPHCPTNPEYYDMADMKDYIVDFHNRIRNEVAGGHSPNFPPASRMATMEWDDVLHFTASLKAQLCIASHDQCHGTAEFWHSGQNVGLLYYIGLPESRTLRDIIESRLESWANESVLLTPDMLLNYPPKEENEERMMAGMFAVMIREENTRVGCGLHRFERVHGHTEVIFICNYSTDNLMGTPVYKQGPAASECKTGANPQYPALCNVGERYFHGFLQE